MQSLKAMLAIFAVLALAGSMTRAQTLVVETWAGTTPESSNSYSSPPSSPASIPIPLTTSTTRINLYSASASNLASIGQMTFSNTTPTNVVDVVIGSGPLETDREINLANAAEDWVGVTFPFATRLSGALHGNLTGAINPTSIVRLEVHGVVSGAISASATSGTAIGYLQLGSTTSTGTITAGSTTAGGDIGTIEGQSTGTTIAGAISAPSGQIFFVTAEGAIDIADAAGISAQDGIILVYATSVDANITSNANDGTGAFTQLYCTEGDYTGVLAIQSLTNSPEGPFISIQGTLNGTISCVEDLAGPIFVHGVRSDGVSIEQINVGLSIGAPIVVEGAIEHVIVDGDIDMPGWILQSPGREITCGSIGELVVGGRIGGQLPAPATVFWVPQIGSISAGSVGNASFYGGLDGQSPLPTHVGDVEVAGDCFGGFLLDSYDGLFRVGGSMRYAGVYFSDAPESFTGQFVVNAANDPANVWDSNFYVYTPFGLQDLTPKPSYVDKSSTFGGGAVGLVPFALYSADCSPVHDDEWDTNPGTDPLLNTQFSHWVNPNNDPEITPKSALMRFYGPINVPANVPPVSVWLWLHDQFWWDVTDLCEFEVSGRAIAIHGAGSNLLPSGFYAALARTTGSNRVTCAGTLVPSNPPSVLANSTDSQNNPVVQYNFYLFPDCNKNDELDSGENTCGPCLADYDDGSGDGVRDGGITIDDLLYYLEVYEDGNIICDIDDGTGTGTPDNGVTIDDLLYYIIRYENGC